MKPLSLLPALIAALTLALTVPVHSAESLTGTLKAIKERKAIRIGHLTDAYPMSFVGPGGEVEGYSIELCKRIAEEVGKTVGITPLKIEYVPTTLEGRFDAVASGKVDIECGTSTITLSRMERVDFTNLSFVDGGGLLVRKGSAINNVAGLVDETVAVIPGTTTEKSLRAALSRSFIKATVIPVKDHARGGRSRRFGQGERIRVRPGSAGRSADQVAKPAASGHRARTVLLRALWVRDTPRRFGL